MLTWLPVDYITRSGSFHAINATQPKEVTMGGYGTKK